MRALALILAAACAAGRAEIVDRVAVSCGRRAITESAITERIRLSAFQNGVPVAVTESARRDAAQLLIDQTLIEAEMGVGHYRRMTPERRSHLLEEWEKEHHNLARLSDYGLIPEQLEQDLARQEDLLNFLSIRFRPAVQISDEDVRRYFEEKLLPNLPPTATVAEYRVRIEQLLVNQRADVDLDAWLREQRKRIRIEYLEKGLE